MIKIKESEHGQLKKGFVKCGIKYCKGGCEDNQLSELYNKAGETQFGKVFKLLRPQLSPESRRGYAGIFIREFYYKGISDVSDYYEIFDKNGKEEGDDKDIAEALRRNLIFYSKNPDVIQKAFEESLKRDSFNEYILACAVSENPNLNTETIEKISEYDDLLSGKKTISFPFPERVVWQILTNPNVPDVCINRAKGFISRNFVDWDNLITKEVLYNLGLSKVKIGSFLLENPKISMNEKDILIKKLLEVCMDLNTLQKPTLVTNLMRSIVKDLKTCPRDYLIEHKEKIKQAILSLNLQKQAYPLDTEDIEHRKSQERRLVEIDKELASRDDDISKLASIMS